MTRKYVGFTLIELMISLAVSGVLMSVAVPTYLSATYSAHSGATRAALLTDVMKASTKAGIHGVRTTLCPSFDGLACSSGFNWSHGWIGFIDQNGSREREPNEALIASQPALPGLSSGYRSRSRISRIAASVVSAPSGCGAAMLA